MAQEKVAGLMSTGLDINETKATESLNRLKSAVRDSVNEWKQMESQMKQAGDTIGASEAKYKGLTESVNKQQTVLEKLRQEQAEVNRSTEAGEQTYQKYATQITAAERQLATMTQQQEQAKRAYELQKSGIAGLNKEIQNSIKETDAYVERLKAEGKEEEALKAQKEGLSRTLDKQTQLYEVQTKQLDKMIKSGDASADSISKQKIALDKTATAIAKGKRSLEELNSEQSNVGKNAGASEASGKFEKLTGTVGKAKLGLVAMGATAGAVLASVTKLVDTIYDQQSQVNELQAKTTSSYKESKEGIQAINKLYVQGFGESLDELQETYIRVKQLNPSDSIQDLTEKTKLASTYAKQSGADIQEVLAGASKATTNLGISYEEYFDLMTTASKKGLDTQGALSDEMAEYSQVLGQMGFSAKDAFGLLENGIKAGAYNTDKLSDFVKEFGISLNDGRMQENIGAFSKNTQQMFNGFKKGKVTSAEMLKAVTQDLAGMTDKQKEATLASNLWSALGEDNALKVVESMGQVNNSFDNVQGSAKKTADQLKNQNPFELAKRGAQTFTSELTLNQDQVKKLKEAFQPLAKALKELFESVVKNLPTIVKHLTPIIDFTAKHLPLLISGLGVLAGLWGTSKIISFGRAIVGAGSDLKKLGTAAKVTGTAIKGAFMFLKATPLGLLITGIALAITALVALYKHNKKFRDFINGIIKSVADMAKDIAKWFSDIWKSVSKWFGQVSDFIGDTTHSISRTWNKSWSSIFKFFGDIWDRINKYGRDAINGISGTIHNVLGSIGKVWRDTWNGLGDFFGGIWGRIKGYAQDGINGVLSVINKGVDAIDSVWKFFTGHETSIRHLKPVKFAQGGIVTQRLAMVNDGDGPDWKELIQLPDGQIKMSHQRNAVLPLPVGTRVYSGKETKAIMNYMGVEKYANGGIVGSAIDWTKGTLSDIGSWIGDKFEAIGNFLKNPLSSVKSLISKATSGMLSGLGNFGQLATGTFDKLSQSIADWFTKGLKKVQEENQDGGGGRGAPAGAGVQRWAEQVKSALSANGLSTSPEMVNKVLRQIQTESGGNERAVQGGYTDINTITGDLAKGLMQTISATFNAFKFPGHGNIFNGYDNLLAALNYAKHRYGPNLSYLGQGHGYENGGIINTHGLYEIAEKNKPEMVIPLAADKRVRANQLLNEANRRINGANFESGTDNGTILKLESKLDSMIALLTQLVQGQGNQTTHVVLDKNALYRQQASDTNLRNIQSLA